MTVAACWKWVTVDDDERWSGVSAADRAALEIAFELAAAADDSDVVVLSVGPASAERGLREAIAAGATRALRIDAPAELTSRAVSVALAGALAGADWVLCGDYSADRGSGSVPALLAAELGAAQALGLVRVEPNGSGLTAVRRLDGGRRERLSVTVPAVLSVEGSVARLRRGSLGSEMAARTISIPVLAGPGGPLDVPDEIAPYRPRARVFPPPPGQTALDRVRALVDTGDGATHGETVSLEPPEAAARIVSALREWGYLS